MIAWLQIDRRFPVDGLGFLPEMLLGDDKRPVKEQLEDRYRHGGGYKPFKGFTLDRRTMALHYPGDPVFKPAVMAVLGDEKIFFYPQGDWLLILQKDDSWEVTRVD